MNTSLNSVDTMHLTNAIPFTNYHDPVFTPGVEQFGLLWKDNSTTYFTRATLLGDMIGNSQAISSFGGGPSGIAWSGGDYGIVISRVSASDLLLYFAKYDSLGNLIAPFNQQISNSSGTYLSPNLLYNGVYFTTLWKDANNQTVQFSHQLP